MALKMPKTIQPSFIRIGAVVREAHLTNAAGGDGVPGGGRFDWDWYLRDGGWSGIDRVVQVVD